MKTKEELLKIFSAYLPYGVKVSPIHILNYGSSQGNGIGSLIHMLTTKSQTYKLHLYSMDMLTKEIEHKGERFIPMLRLIPGSFGTVKNFNLNQYDNHSVSIFKNTDTLEELHIYTDNGFSISTRNHSFNVSDYKMVQKLLEWHFNVFGLDESEYIPKQSVRQK